MRATILLFCLLCAAAAFGQLGQYGGGYTPIQSSFHIPDSSIRALSQPMSVEQNLLGNNALTSAQGEMPLWEAPQPHEVPLGDIARALRKEHATAKKARLVLEK